MENMNDTQREIMRILSQLDDKAIAVEAKWGIGTIETLVSKSTLEKWQRQLAKLEDAIHTQNIPLLHELASGAVRGWAAMENEAIAAGHTPNEPTFWEVTAHNGAVYRFYKNYSDAKAAHKPAGPPVIIMAIQEAANMDQAARERVFAKEPQKETRTTPADQKFNFKKGDDIPF